MPITNAVNPIESTLVKGYHKYAQWLVDHPRTTAGIGMGIGAATGSQTKMMGGGENHRLRGALTGAGTSLAGDLMIKYFQKRGF